MKNPAPAQQILAEQGYIILAADVLYPLGSMTPLADCGPDYERIPGPMVVIGGATIDEWRAQAKNYLGNLPPEPGGKLFFKVVAERDRDGRSAPVGAR